LKAIGKKRVLNEVYRAIGRLTGDKINGSRNASALINIMANDDFDIKEAKKYRITDGIATDRQHKAVYRLLFGRHYSAECYETIKDFITNPEFFTNHITRRSKIIWIDATPGQETDKKEKIKVEIAPVF